MTSDEIINLLLNNNYKNHIQKHEVEFSRKPYRLILGDQPYKDANDRIYLIKIPYSAFNNEVAFFSNHYKITMFFVLSLILNSHVEAQRLIEKMKANQLQMSVLLDFLLEYSHIVFLNRNDDSGKKVDYKKILNVVKNFNITKVLILGENQSKTSKKLLKAFNTNNVVYDQILHPSSKSCAYNPQEWIDFYILKKSNLLNRVSYSDFYI